MLVPHYSEELSKWIHPLCLSIITHPKSFKANISRHGSWTFSGVDITSGGLVPSWPLTAVSLLSPWHLGHAAEMGRLPSARRKEAKLGQAHRSFWLIAFAIWNLSITYIIYFFTLEEILMKLTFAIIYSCKLIIISTGTLWS